MEPQAFESLCRDIFEKNGLETYCREPYLGLFGRFLQVFVEENAKTNLSAIRAPMDIIAKHFADCLLAADQIPDRATLLDVGCGGGFPTVPLAIARPELQITAMDSTQKKLDCVGRMTSALGLCKVTTVCGRAETLARTSMRGAFDAVIGRAVANLCEFVELSLPFVRVGGLLVAMKGARGAEELAEAQSAVRTLGGRTERDLSVSLACPFPSPDDPEQIGGYLTESRHLLLIRKEKETPALYPRPYAAIRKRPL